MNYQEYMLPVILSNLLAIIIMLSCLQIPKIMRAVMGLIFIVAGFINLINVYNNPSVYVDGFGPVAIDVYKDIIYGPFSKQPGIYVALISIGQVLVGALLWLKKFWYNVGAFGGFIFFVAIIPLGAGSAFPAPVFLAIGMLSLLFRKRRKTLFGT